MTSLVAQGFYIPDSDDQGDTSASTWNNIATYSLTADTDTPITGAELARLNSALGGTSSIDGLVYLPTGSEAINSTPNNLAGIANNGSFIYDTGNETAYSVGAGTGDGPVGGLYIMNSSGGVAAYYAPGTWSDISNDDDGDGGSGDTTTSLPLPSGEPSAHLTTFSGGGGTLTGGNGSSTDTFSSSDGPIYVVPDADVDGGYLVYQIGGPAYEVNTDGTLSSSTSPFAFPFGGPLTDASLMPLLASSFNSASTDPIVLDLSGEGGGTATGVQLTSLADSDAYFDLHDTGFAVHTGWVGPETGILVNTTDPTNITDLFGNSSTSGFAALQALDVYGTGVLNSSDPGWSSLYVWVDANGNGVADSGEVQSLSSLGITSISLETTPINETVNGNVIGEVATFTYSDDSTGQVAEAYFDNSQMDSTYTGSYTLNPETGLLPDLRGYGTMPALYIAESLDTTLLGEAQYLATDNLGDAATFSQQVTTILYEWAGVASTAPTSRGDYVNAQDLGVLEAVNGESWINNDNGANSGDPANSNQSQVLESAFVAFQNNEMTSLLAQGPLAQYLPGVTYDYDTDSLTGTTDLSTLATAVGANIPSDPGTAVQYLATMGQFMDQLASDLSISQSEFDSALSSDFATAGQSLTTTLVDDLHYMTPAYVSGDVTFSPDSIGGDIMTGISGYENILSAGSTDLTQDIVTNVQELEIGGTALSVTLTNAQFNEFSTITGDSSVIIATDAGTYDLATTSASGIAQLYAYNSSANVTLIGDNENDQTLVAGTGNDTLTEGNGNGDALDGGSGTDTLTAGSGNGDTLTAGSGTNTLIAGNGTGDNLIAGSGVDTMEGGTGGDTFQVYGTLASGSSITGAGTGNTIYGYGDISGATVTGVQALSIGGIAESMAVTSEQMGEFTSITGNSSILSATDAGTYDLSSISTSGISQLYAYNSSADVTLIGDDENYQTLVAGTGNDTLTGGNGYRDALDGGSGADILTAGNGDEDILTAGSGTTTLIAGTGAGDNLVAGSGVDTMEGGTGGDTFQVYGTLASGSSIAGEGTGNTIFGYGDISGTTVSDIQTLSIGGTATAVTLTAEQFAAFDSITGSSSYIYATDAGTYDLSSISASGIGVLDAANTSADVTLIGDDEDYQTLVAGSGNDTLTAGNGYRDTLDGGSGTDTLTAGNGDEDTINGGSGTNTLIVGSGNGDVLYAGYANDTLVAGTGNDTLYGNIGTNTYQFGSGFGQDTIYDAGASGSAAGTIAFTSGITDENLWFQQSGNDLLIDVVGTTSQIDVSNWYASGGSQVTSFTADGLTLDTQFASLVSAMATYSAAHTSFNPQTATSMPTDTTLQSAIAASWHS